jgi:nucleoside-diphosphate-sugar epimerase
MRVFVSGATGFIGTQLVNRLVEMGITVHALYRSESKTAWIRKEGVILFKGDILDRESLRCAMAGCTQAYHVAAFAGAWTRNPETIYRFNVNGTVNMLEAAGENGIRRVVVCSTAGVLGPSDSRPADEATPAPDKFFTPYEASKLQMERQILAMDRDLPEVVIVNPTRVYGPGQMSESNGVTRMILQYLRGKWHLVPGNGRSTSNYVHGEDVVSGHIVAMEKGKPGNRYILGGEHLTYDELFSVVRQVSGKRYRLFHVPLWFMLAISFSMLSWARLTGMRPLIVPGLVRKFNHHWLVSSEKAIKELGYSYLTASKGIAQTIRWIESNQPIHS